MNILLIDNYDSFVHNLARYCRELGANTLIKRNDKLNLEDVLHFNTTHIIISPGPKTPSEAGITLKIIKQYENHIPILGVCLGHQAIAQAYGGKIIRAQRPLHGKSSTIFHNNEFIFKNLKNPLNVGRYHSLIVSEEFFPCDLSILARCDRGEIMAIAHKNYPTYGVQFHPESILTEAGKALLKNFLNFSFFKS